MATDLLVDSDWIEELVSIEVVQQPDFSFKKLNAIVKVRVNEKYLSFTTATDLLICPFFQSPGTDNRYGIYWRENQIPLQEPSYGIPSYPSGSNYIVSNNPTVSSFDSTSGYIEFDKENMILTFKNNIERPESYCTVNNMFLGPSISGKAVLPFYTVGYFIGRVKTTLGILNKINFGLASPFPLDLPERTDFVFNVHSYTSIGSYITNGTLFKTPLTTTLPFYEPEIFMDPFTLFDCVMAYVDVTLTALVSVDYLRSYVDTMTISVDGATTTSKFDISNAGRIELGPIKNHSNVILTLNFTYGISFTFDKLNKTDPTVQLLLGLIPGYGVTYI